MSWGSARDLASTDLRADGTPPDEPRVTIEMDGPNIVIRATAAIDHAYTATLVEAVNAATDTEAVVVIDPDPIPCDESFATDRLPASEVTCTKHIGCRPAAVEVVASGIVRIPAERTVWTVDVAAGRFCQTDTRLDVHFLDANAWIPVIAVCITPSRLRALCVDGSVISAHRAHEAPQAA